MRIGSYGRGEGGKGVKKWEMEEEEVERELKVGEFSFKKISILSILPIF